MLSLILLGVVVLLLGRVAYCLSDIAQVQRTAVENIAHAVAPLPERTFLDDLVDTPVPQRSILDQLGMLLAEMDTRLKRIEGTLGYLRNYVWEEHDRRPYRQVVPFGKESPKFSPSDNPEAYNLWRRERDDDDYGP